MHRCYIVFVDLYFTVKDGYNKLFAGSCTRYNRYNTYGDGNWVSSLNKMLKLHSAIVISFFFFLIIIINFLLAAHQLGRIQDIALTHHRYDLLAHRHCSKQEFDIAV